MQNYNWGTWYFWEKFPMSVTFDGPNKLILVNDGITSLDVQSDIYSNWKKWMLYQDNAKFLPAFTAIGGQPLPSGDILDLTVFLINGWRLKPYPGSYTLQLNGNIFDVDGGEIKVDADNLVGEPNNISITSNLSAIVRRLEAGGGDGNVDSITGSISNIESDVTSILNYVMSIDSNVNTVTSSLTTISSDITNIDSNVNTVTGSLTTISSDITNISSSINNIIASGSSDTLVLEDLQNKLNELWLIHGLDTGSALLVTPSARVAGSVSQTISGTGSVTVQRI